MGTVKVSHEEKRACPICGKTYAEHPALSRKDNKTLICPDCGVREALASIGVELEEQEKIIMIIHGAKRGEEDE